MSRGPSARELAARVVARVTGEDAFAAAALEAELTRAVQLEPRDRALATELVYGSLRVLPWLRAEVTRFAPRGIDGLDARVQAHLLVAAYQLCFTRLPPFAVVSEAVAAVRAVRDARLGGFVNAVLRKVATRAGSLDDAGREQARIESLPRWLRDAVGRSVSAEAAAALLGGGGEPPAVALRVRSAAARDEWLGRLRTAAPEATFEPGRVSPLAILARRAGRTQSLPGWSEGAWAVQEEGSQLAALAVGVVPGERVLDACAGRGNKTGVLAAAAGDSGVVDACDTSAAKLDRLRQELARLGLHVASTHAVDWRVGPGDVSGLYDRVLVDAPCTGTGTLRRRPEIALRLEEASLAGRRDAQVAIASRAADRVTPGGSLVYVVCSVLREEGEDVVDALRAARPDLEPAPFDAPEAAALAAGASQLRLLPHLHGTDGYFIARWTRRG